MRTCHPLPPNAVPAPGGAPRGSFKTAWGSRARAPTAPSENSATTSVAPTTPTFVASLHLEAAPSDFTHAAPLADPLPHPFRRWVRAARLPRPCRRACFAASGPTRTRAPKRPASAAPTAASPPPPACSSAGHDSAHRAGRGRVGEGTARTRQYTPSLCFCAFSFGPGLSMLERKRSEAKASHSQPLAATYSRTATRSQSIAEVPAPAPANRRSQQTSAAHYVAGRTDRG